MADENNVVLSLDILPQQRMRYGRAVQRHINTSDDEQEKPSLVTKEIFISEYLKRRPFLMRGSDDDDVDDNFPMEVL
jgi:hypothetical protein